jgi:plasmid stabilization system protein ParE
MRVKWLRRALDSLDDEAAYIARDSPRTAAEFVMHMRDSAAMDHAYRKQTLMLAASACG